MKNIFAFLQNFQTYSGAHPAFSAVPEVKRLGHEANHSSPSNAEVKNKWSYTSASPMLSWHAV